MSWTNLSLLALVLCIIGVVGVFGAYAGYEVNGVVQGFNADSNSNLGIEILSFIGNMIAFRVDNVPFALNVVFVIISILSLYLLYSSIRGIG